MATSTSDAPSAVLAPPCIDGRLTRTTPAKPTVSPTSWTRAGARRSRIDATSAENSGSAPFSIPVTPEEIHCSAIGNIVIGNAIQVSPTRAMRGQSLRSTCTRRAAGKQLRAPNPKTTRNNVIRPGSSASRPSAIRRNDDPQIREAASRSPQSTGVNAAALVPSAVEISRCRAAGAPSAAPSAIGRSATSSASPGSGSLGVIIAAEGTHRTSPVLAGF